MALIAYAEDGTVLATFERIVPYVDENGETQRGTMIYPDNELPSVGYRGEGLAGIAQWPDVLPFDPVKVVVSRKQLRALVSKDGQKVSR